MTHETDHGLDLRLRQFLKVPYMKNLTILLIAVVAASLYAVCPSCTDVPDAGVQESAQADSVTFHVIGMKKTASGAT